MNGWVDGYITNCNNGNPISGVLVTVDGTSGSSTTGSTGYYIPIQLPPCGTAGTGCAGYTVRATKSGYQETISGGVHIRSGTGTRKSFCMPPV